MKLYGLRGLLDCNCGQIAPGALFGLLFFMTLTAIIVNAGLANSQKIRLQNGTDAIAMAHATMAAQDLNVISMNNLAIVQTNAAYETTSLTFSVLTEFAAEVGVRIAEITLEENKWCDPIPPPISAPCYAGFETLKAPLEAAEAFAGAHLTDTFPAVKNSLNALSALSAMNNAIAAEYSKETAAIDASLASVDDVHSAYVFRCAADPLRTGCSGSSRKFRADRQGEGYQLPVLQPTASPTTRIQAMKSLCDASFEGTDGSHRADFLKHGFQRGEGPASAGGASYRPDLKDYSNTFSGLVLIFSVGDLLSLTKTYEDFLRDLPLGVGGETQIFNDEDQSRSDNEYVRAVDSYWSAMCGTSFSPDRFATATLAGGALPALPQGSIPFVPGASDAAFDPIPYKYLAFGEGGMIGRLFGVRFKQAERDQLAYAQALVFNPTSADLYTSDWRARLMPADLLDDKAIRPAIADFLASTGDRNVGWLSTLLADRTLNATEFSKANVH